MTSTRLRNALREANENYRIKTAARLALSSLRRFAETNDPKDAAEATRLLSEALP